MVRWILFGSLRNSSGRSLLGSNGTENSLKDSGDFDHLSLLSVPGAFNPAYSFSRLPAPRENAEHLGSVELAGYPQETNWINADVIHTMDPHNFRDWDGCWRLAGRRPSRL